MRIGQVTYTGHLKYKIELVKLAEINKKDMVLDFNLRTGAIANEVIKRIYNNRNGNHFNNISALVGIDI